MEFDRDDRTLHTIGEQGLLQRLQAFCPADLVGDDAAVLVPTPGKSLVVTTDMLVDEVHFSDRTTPPESVGWRSAAANLSDLAAMGATPLGITVGLALPPDVTIAWVDRLYQGMTDCLNRYHTPIVGGDVVRSPIRSLSITAFGEVDPTRVIRRSTAQFGDAIVATGYHGSSRAGLECLLQGADQSSWIRAHQFPTPRLDVLPFLTSDRIAGMDSSDGLADAVLQICRASGVGARLDTQTLPIDPTLFAAVGSEKAVEWSLYGGEDFELVLCLARSHAEQLVHQLGNGAAIVGEIVADSRVMLYDSIGLERELSLRSGFQHFNAS